MDHRTRLRELLVERSVRLGDFTLASGARSSYYIDARRTSMTAEGQFLIGKVCRSAISESGWSATHVGGLTMGADPVAYAVAHASWSEPPHLDAFSVRKEAKGHGTGQRLEGGLPSDASVVVVEDTVTTGRSLLDAVRAVRGHGASVSGVLALVDRGEGGEDRLQAEGLPLLAVFTADELVSAARRRVAADEGDGR